MKIPELINFALLKNASDLHISPGSPLMLRINGKLCVADDFPSSHNDTTKNLIYNLLNDKQIQQFENDLELDFAINLPTIARLRVNAFHQLHGISAAIRIIPEKIPTLDQLQAPALFKQLVQSANGLILITGPTGSGKSTTLAALLDYINTHFSLHIITIEDPIEFIHPNKKCLVTQRQIHHHTRSYHQALRAALREDPDVILIGEMRDLETIRLALTAAETGHLVMATLHTSSAPKAINRIIDVFPAGEKNTIRNLLSDSLQAVIYQTLVNNLAGNRVAAFEIMLATPAIRHLIREDKTAQMQSAIQTGNNVGMCTMEQYLQTIS